MTRQTMLQNQKEKGRKQGYNYKRGKDNRVKMRDTAQSRKEKLNGQNEREEREERATM